MQSTSLTGQFIIAMPNLQDMNFDQSVTYICEHDENGCFGLIINKPTEVTLSEVIAEMKIEAAEDAPVDERIFLGGPVQPDRGFILHNPPGDWSSSLKVNDQIALTTSKDILEAIARNDGPEHSIVALGYAGWGPGQLEAEMAANSWLNCPADQQIIFHTPAADRWKAAADVLGIDLTLLSNDPGHA